jgi:hypothetical protein
LVLFGTFLPLRIRTGWRFAVIQIAWLHDIFGNPDGPELRIEYDEMSAASGQQGGGFGITAAGPRSGLVELIVRFRETVCVAAVGGPGALMVGRALAFYACGMSNPKVSFRW